jgi:RimJ/RimL family protein N-acetyltransferase
MAHWGNRHPSSVDQAMANTLVTRRLLMVQLDVEEAVALVDGRGGSGRLWAPGYPDDGALVAAGLVMTAAKQGRDLGPFGTYEIIRRRDGAVIGAAGFVGPPDDTGAVRVGYGLAESARGHGYATEALRGLLDWARGQDGLTCVLADTTRTNVASQRVMERAGMSRIGEEGELLYYMA